MRQRLIAVLLVLVAVVNAQTQRQINVDVTQEKGKLNTFFNECVGAGRAGEGLRADWQDQFRIIQKACNFKFLRFHGIFHEDMGVYTETDKGEPIYNFQYVDRLYDFVLSTGAKPFVELSFMPKAMASGEKTVFWWEANVTPPTSLEKYEALILELTNHLTERYGEEEVKSWYFEVWNEPDHSSFFTGSKADYFEMYRHAVLAIRSVCDDYRVGGPATARISWVRSFLDFCDSENLPVDFVSTHGYNVDGFLDEFGKKQLRLSKNPHQVSRTVLIASKWVKQHNLSDVELHFTEWSSSYSPLDPVHDTYQNAPFVLNTLKSVEDSVTSMSYWTFTDIFEEAGVPTKPFHGGFGLLTLQDIKKPTFFAYKYLNHLGETELVNDDKYSWVCKSGDDVQMLIYDFSYPKQGNKSNKEYFTMNHPTKLSSVADISIQNLKDGKYEVKIYKTGYRQNDAFTLYYDMGQPDCLSRDQEQYIKSQVNDASIRSEIIKVKNGTYSSSFELNENDILFIELVKM